MLSDLETTLNITFGANATVFVQLFVYILYSISGPENGFTVASVLTVTGSVFMRRFKQLSGQHTFFFPQLGLASQPWGFRATHPICKKK